MTPLEFANTLKGKVQYRFLRALFKAPTKRPFNPDSPFLTSFDTHKSPEGNTYWYEINECFKKGEPLITWKLQPEFKYKDAPNESVLFVRIVERDGSFDLVALAFARSEDFKGVSPIAGETIKSSHLRKHLKKHKSDLYLIEYI